MRQLVKNISKHKYYNIINIENTLFFIYKMFYFYNLDHCFKYMLRTFMIYNIWFIGRLAIS